MNIKPSDQCPVCDSRETAEFASAVDLEWGTCEGETFNYRRCKACRSVYLQNPPVDRLHEIYPSNYYSFKPQGGGSESLVQRIKEKLDGRAFRKVIDELKGDKLAVLDVGGGTGWLLSLIRRLSPRVAETHELDIDETARAAAEADGHVFHCTRVEEFEPPRKFDLIIMLNLIEHVADPAAVLRAMRNALAPGGMILLKTPNVDTVDQHLFRHLNWGGFHCPRHFVLFTKQSMIDMAARCGLSCVSAKYTQGAPQWTNSVLCVLKKLRLINMGRAKPSTEQWLFMPLAAFFAAFDYLRMPLMKTAQMVVVLKNTD